MLESYIPIVILIGIALVLALLLMTLSRALGPFRPNRTKLNPYESGMDPVGKANERYSIGFYLIAMEFIVFDLEVIFVFPWAVRYMELGFGTLMAMVVFIIILFVGLAYTLKKGTVDLEVRPALTQQSTQVA